jgi:hypothetical protein
MKAAQQRLDVAEEILEVLKRTLEAQYIGGYSLECSLKALILEVTPEADRADVLEQITQGAKYHRHEVLLDRLRERGISITPELAKRLRRYDWSTDLRYETGRKDTGETIGMLKTVRAVYNWVEVQLS